MVLHYMLINYSLFLNSHELHLTVQFSITDIKKISSAVFSLVDTASTSRTRGGATSDFRDTSCENKIGY